MDRCDACKNISKCAICGASSDYFHHVGVRGTTNRLRIPVIDYNVTYDKQPSGVWHYSQSCNHRVYLAATSSIVKHDEGPSGRTVTLYRTFTGAATTRSHPQRNGCRS